MKKSRICFVMLISVIISMCCLSCDENCEGCGDTFPFVEYTQSTTFYDTYTSYTGTKALIDIRVDSLYNSGHLDGAVNLPFVISYTDTEKEQWGKTLLEKYQTNTCLFIYGATSFELNKRVAKCVSRLGYGMKNVRIFSKGYDDLQSVWK